jgi:hypothetical protein
MVAVFYFRCEPLFWNSKLRVMRATSRPIACQARDFGLFGPAFECVFAALP